MEHTFTEKEIRNEALRELANEPTGSLGISELIIRLTNRLSPVGHDAEMIDGRSDNYFSQKVRNLVSHRNQGTGLVANGFVQYQSSTPCGVLKITQKGRDYIDQLGSG